MFLTALQIAQFTQGSFVAEPAQKDISASSLTWDSREVAPGAAYVALPGEHVDGHSFVASALRAGAVIALVMQPLPEETLRVAREMGAGIIQVANTHDAITDLARGWRGLLRGTVIGLTGSSGKTTTKNLVRDVLSYRNAVVATKANQNNELGVPRTLLNADLDTDYVVVEMGMRGMHQIETLCEFVKPSLGIIVNVGESHIELLGGRDNIARAKGELFQALPSETGVAFVNGADDYASFVCELARLQERHVKVISYGLTEGPVLGSCGVWAENIVSDEEGQPCFDLCAQGFGGEEIERVSVTLQLRGLHNVSNATGAAAIGRFCGMTLEDIAAALSAAQPESGRQQVLKAEAGYTVINDAYNANPESMKASLVTFSAMATEGRHIAVLGDMGELGDFAPACHEGIGILVPTLNIDVLVCIGELSAYIARAAREAGMDDAKIIQAQNIDEVLSVLKPTLQPTDAVLVKASHFMELFHVGEGLIE